MPRILVTGATGTFGGAVLQQLAERGESFRVMSRDPTKLPKLSERVEVFQGDFAEPESLLLALDGIERVFLASFDSPQQRELQGNLLMAAKHQGVQQVVRISTAGVEELHHLNVFGWHYEGEQQLEASGLAYTHLRPGWVTQNLLPSSSASPVTADKIRLPAGQGAVSYVDARDVAAVAVAALTEPGHENQAYELTGPEALAHDEIARLLSEASGRPITYDDLTPEAYDQLLTDQGWPRNSIAMMLELYESVRGGHDAGVVDTVERVTGRPALTVADFARDYAEAFRAGN